MVFLLGGGAFVLFPGVSPYHLKGLGIFLKKFVLSADGGVGSHFSLFPDFRLFSAMGSVPFDVLRLDYLLDALIVPGFAVALAFIVFG